MHCCMPSMRNPARSTLVINLAGTGAQQAREGVRHDVFGRAKVSEHPEGQVNRVRAMLPVGLADRRVVLFSGHPLPPAAVNPLP